MSSPADDPAPFTAEDLPLLAALAHHNAAALRRDDPARARAWIEALSVHPYYKGGQFLFDLLEWEDFMLDGEAPPVLDEVTVAAALDRAARVLDALRAAIDSRPLEVQPVATRVAVSDPAVDLPPLAGN